jgi:hypothetical protein
MFYQNTDNFWNQLERLETQIKGAEVKAGILFSFHSFIIGLFINKIELFSEVFNDNIPLIILVVCWGILVLISVYYCFSCFIPRMELKYDDNVFFYKDAIKAYGNLTKFKAKMIEVCTNEDELHNQLSEQVHVESKIVNKKFESVKKSIKFFAFSLIFLVLILVYYMIRI